MPQELSNENDIKVDGKTMCLSHVKKLHDADSPRPLVCLLRFTGRVNCYGYMRAAPKLRQVHTNPPHSKRMKVKYAVQVFSSSVARGMQLYYDVGE